MAASNINPAPAQLQQDKPAVTHSGPMSEQGCMGGHGYEMHPQKFLRLVGCHEPAPKRETADLVH